MILGQLMMGARQTKNAPLPSLMIADGGSFQKKLFSHFSSSIFEIFYMDVKISREIYFIHIELSIQFHQMEIDLVKVMKS